MLQLLPLLFVGLYVFSVSRQEDLSEAVRTLRFWIPIMIMGGMLLIQMMFGMIGLIVSVIIMVFMARRLAR
jgi:hypothetical protein